MVSCKQTLVKTLIWRFIATGITFLIVLVTTKSYTKSAGVATIDTTIKAFAYFGYERLWIRCVNKEKEGTPSCDSGEETLNREESSESIV